MQVLPFILAASLMDLSLPLYHVADAKLGIEDSWSQVALERDGSCEIEVTGDGRFYRIAMSGFAPGEIGYFEVDNDQLYAMTFYKAEPDRYMFKADETGAFSKIYLPFLRNHRESTVSVNARGEDCDVHLSFPWKRFDVRVH